MSKQKSTSKRKRSRQVTGTDDEEDTDETHAHQKIKFNFSPQDKDDEDGIEVQSDVDEEKQQRLNERDPLQTQLFLKNLPLDTNEAEMMTYFATYFGAVKRVLLVRNKTDKTLTGSGFVHCGSLQLADKIFGAAQQNAREVSSAIREDFHKQTESMSHHQAKKIKYKLRGNT